MNNNYILLQSYKVDLKKNDNDVYKILKKILIKNNKNDIDVLNNIDNETSNLSIKIGKIVDYMSDNMGDDFFEEKIRQEFEKNKIKKVKKIKEKR